MRKPLLLEEFGKKLSAVEYVNGSIGGKRDPIFRSMYRTVEDALAACASLTLTTRQHCHQSSHLTSSTARQGPAWRLAGIFADFTSPNMGPALQLPHRLTLHCMLNDRGRGLTGSLFWRWDVQVYAGAGPTDYGVRRFDSTFSIIGSHAATVRPPLRDNKRMLTSCTCCLLHVWRGESEKGALAKTAQLRNTLVMPYHPNASENKASARTRRHLCYLRIIGEQAKPARI